MRSEHIVILFLAILGLFSFSLLVDCGESRRRECAARKCAHGSPHLLRYHGCVCLEAPLP